MLEPAITTTTARTDGSCSPGNPYFGQSYLGSAIKRSVTNLHGASISTDRIAALGEIESVVINNPNYKDEGIARISSKITHCKDFFYGITYKLDAHSEAAQKLFSAIAAKQKEQPDFPAFIAYNTLSSSSFGQISKLLEQTGAKISFGQFRNHFSRNSLHQKLFIMDCECAAIGGDNIDNPKEADAIAFIKGGMVKTLIDEGINIWGRCKDHVYAAGQSHKSFLTKLLLSEDRTLSTEAQTPMMLLNKEGVKYLGDYYKNPADVGLFAAIDSARQSLNIVCPNLNDALLLEKLTNAALRGVDVKIMLPRNYQNFGSWLDRAGNYIAMLHRAHLPKEARKNFKVRWYSEDKSHYSDNHTKYYSADGLVAFLGSLNGDNQSLCFSQELLLAIEDKKSVRRLDQQIFTNTWNTSIPAKEHWSHKVLPIPGATLLRRLSNFYASPLALLMMGLKHLKQFVLRKPLDSNNEMESMANL